MWATIQENDFETETEELLHYYRTQTLTKDYSDFLLQAVKTGQSLSQSAQLLLQKRPGVILEGTVRFSGPKFSDFCLDFSKVLATLTRARIPVVNRHTLFFTE